jgi:enoyl-CoA hydratase/carnithine racemase
MRQPVIAMVNGPAVGYGAELAMQADFRIVGTSALFLLPFSELGVVSDTGAATWLLPRLIGWSKAAELLYCSRRITGAEAVAIGLANYVVADEELRAFTDKFATDLASRSALALTQLKQMIFGGLDERKAEHVLGQHLRFQHRDPSVDVTEYAARARGGSRPRPQPAHDAPRET